MRKTKKENIDNGETTSVGNPSWQLEVFQRSLKKRLKLQALLQLTGDLAGKRCLLVTCGDNNGALNWYFRHQGGRWHWADLHDDALSDMRTLLGEPVHHVEASRLPFVDDTFDCVVSIDVLEHLPEDQPFLCEVRRVLRTGGRAVVTVPNGDPTLIANRIKCRVGMTPEVYGHTRAGYTAAELRSAIGDAGLVPTTQGGYSRFFTEMMELFINFGYIFVLSRKHGGAKQGQIAPTTAGEMKSHGIAYRLYSVAYPIMRMVSKLDRWLPATWDNAVIVAAVKADAAQ